MTFIPFMAKHEISAENLTMASWLPSVALPGMAVFASLLSNSVMNTSQRTGS